MSKENSILALKLLTQEELAHYAYYVGEALAGASKNIEEWGETWKQQKKEIESLRKDREKLIKTLRIYASSNNWNSIYSDNGPIFFSEDVGGELARTTLKELRELE